MGRNTPAPKPRKKQRAKSQSILVRSRQKKPAAESIESLSDPAQALADRRISLLEDKIRSLEGEIAELKMKYCCIVCHKFFSRSDNLRRHIEGSNDKRHEALGKALYPTQCQSCKKTFPRPCDLNRHERGKKCRAAVPRKSQVALALSGPDAVEFVDPFPHLEEVGFDNSASLDFGLNQALSFELPCAGLYLSAGDIPIEESSSASNTMLFTQAENFQANHIYCNTLLFSTQS